MRGAMLGDLAGSPYEFANVRSKEFLLYSEGPLRTCYLTDDSICTAAIADAILLEEPFSKTLRLWCRGYPEAGYGAMFKGWVNTSDGPNMSWGNGATMRVSPCALLATSDLEAISLARSQAEVSHAHPNAVYGAMALAHAIRLAYRKEPVDAIRRRLERQWGFDLNISMEGLQHELNGVFECSAGGCFRVAVVCALEATSFEDAIRNCISLGGDCDTTAAMAGPIAEALFGIPDEFIAILRKSATFEINELMDRVYHDSRSQATLSGDMGDSFDEVMWEEENRRILTGNQMYLKLYAKTANL